MSQKESEWEKEFDTLMDGYFTVMGHHKSPDKEEIKAFIRETLATREKEIAEEVERMKVYLPQAHPDWSENYGRNDTINKVLQILKH